MHKYGKLSPFRHVCLFRIITVITHCCRIHCHVSASYRQLGLHTRGKYKTTQDIYSSRFSVSRLIKSGDLIVRLLYLISVLVRLPALHVLVQPVLIGIVQPIALARRPVTTKLLFKQFRDPSNFAKNFLSKRFMCN